MYTKRLCHANERKAIKEVQPSSVTWAVSVGSLAPSYSGHSDPWCTPREVNSPIRLDAAAKAKAITLPCL